MPAYFIAQVDIKDLEKFGEYAKATPPLIEKYGGKFLVRGGPMEKVNFISSTTRSTRRRMRACAARYRVHVVRRLDGDFAWVLLEAGGLRRAGRAARRTATART